MATVEKVLLARLKADPNQPRKTFTSEELRQLGESLKVMQIQPVLARPDGTIIDGERRWRAAQLVGLEKLDVIVTDKPLSDSEIKVIQLTSSLLRQDLTGYEKWTACAEMMCMNPSWQMKDLADSLHLDPSMVTRLLSPSRCSPAWQEALMEGKVGISDCYAASKLPEKEQAELLAMKLSGSSRDAIESAGAKKRNGTVPAVKVNRIKIELASGVTAVFTGKELSLDEAIEAASEAHKLMKKGQEQGLTAKTIQKVSADRAKA